MEAHLEGLVAAEQHLTIQIIIMQVVEVVGILEAAAAQRLEAERAAVVDCRVQPDPLAQPVRPVPLVRLVQDLPGRRVPLDLREQLAALA